MSIRLDHIVIAVNDLETASNNYRRLGFTLYYGGEHASGTTHNALICFQDGTYIELLAPTGKERRDTDATDFSGLLAHGEGLVAYALACDDLETHCNAMKQRGLNVIGPTPGERLRPDGMKLQWKTASVDGSMAPFFIEDVTPRNCRVSDDIEIISHRNGATGVLALGFAVPDVPGWLQRYYGLLGANPQDIIPQSFVLDGSTVLTCQQIAEAPAEAPTHLLLYAQRQHRPMPPVTLDPELTHGAAIHITIPGVD